MHDDIKTAVKQNNEKHADSKVLLFYDEGFFSICILSSDPLNLEQSGEKRTPANEKFE